MSLSDFILFIEWIIYLFQVVRSVSIEAKRASKKQTIICLNLRRKKKQHRDTIEKGSVLCVSTIETIFNGRRDKKAVHYFSRELLYFCRFGIWLFSMKEVAKQMKWIVHVIVCRAFNRQHVRLSAVRADGKLCVMAQCITHLVRALLLIFFRSSFSLWLFENVITIKTQW